MVAPGTVNDTSTDFQSLVATGPDLNTVADPDGVWLYVSPSCRRLFGWEPADLLGRHEEDFCHPDDRALVEASRAELARTKMSTTAFRFGCRDGSYLWVERTSLLDRIDGARVSVSAIRDIAERQHQESVLQVQALTDPLTGVANRTVLMDRLRQALHRLGRTGGVVAVVYLDLDRFKVVNDSLGHAIGDRVLLSMAERLTGHLRATDTLARLGGDEFVIVAEDLTNEAAAVEMAGRVIDAGREPFVVGDEQFVCTLSAGIAWTADAHHNADELLQEADLALYRAKDRGRDRAELFDKELRTTAVGRLVTERMIRRAIDEQRIVVEYQPILDLRVGRLCGVEALVRIRQPDSGMVYPGAFLVTAEETGLLVQIDELVLADSMTQASAWQGRFADNGFTDMAINVTARHLADPRFASSVIGRLDQAEIPHHHLQVEVTESILMEASNSAMTSLRALRAAGVQVGLDDFGTGYSSLAYLRQFPLNFVKIDRSFVRDLDQDSSDQAIVAAIITLSHALGLSVVAEGVETALQLDALKALECDRVQGFLFAPSLSPAAVTELVRQEPLLSG